MLNYLITGTETFIEWVSILNSVNRKCTKEKKIFTMNDSLVIKLLFRLEA